jgi:hypothetical protein
MFLKDLIKGNKHFYKTFGKGEHLHTSLLYEILHNKEFQQII